MIEIEAEIKLFKGDGKRVFNMNSGYRPLVWLTLELKVSGSIQLHGQEFLEPGESCIATVTFLHKDIYLQYLQVGKILPFEEGNYNILGTIKVLRLL